MVRFPDRIPKHVIPNGLFGKVSYCRKGAHKIVGRGSYFPSVHKEDNFTSVQGGTKSAELIREISPTTASETMLRARIGCGPEDKAQTIGQRSSYRGGRLR